MTRTVPARLRPSFDPRERRAALAVLTVEALAVLAYFALTPATVERVRYVVYPFVWIDAGLWAVYRTAPNPGNRRHRLVGLLVAAGYLLVVTWIPGKIGFGVHDAPLDLRVGWYVPGWGPLVAFVSPWLRLYLVPFEVVGYASLAYLVYANVLDLTRGVLSGLLGLVTCVGCTAPVLVPLVGLLGGPATSLATTAYRWSYDLGTVVFLATLGLLYASHRRSAPERADHRNRR